MQTAIQPELFIKMVISNWEIQNTRLDKLLEDLSDEQLSAETAPGRNTGTYLLGHLIAINDGMQVLMSLGDKLYPDLQNIFVDNADKSGFTFPSIAELKTYWNKVNETLRQHFNNMQFSAWFTRHMAVSEEDFAKEPHRNKLNILINRTNHQSYHLGQMAYLKK
ncbi:DinB family protein [Panacibacter ginsenosidivorans]|uniref:DinB family protein n=1 Tax=Panacibacter ginsenosidivorans TaxID=1813871 RepID=A0A5B8VD74_9BACT|nr:DinB family protein [Panacibacter ginsenosidivorans]QEC69414.1 DinB family protein [Panacibacter ginsenosidivorans]